MRYTVLEKQSLAELCEVVNEAIGNGWRPIGGVAASVVQLQDREDGWDNQVWYAQALSNEEL